MSATDMQISARLAQGGAAWQGGWSSAWTWGDSRPFGRLAAPLVTDTRRHDLDALRVAAIGLLILTHVSYIYRTDWWRVHSTHAGLWANVLVDAMAPWRMSLVFFIAGAATKFMLERQPVGAFITGRATRLLLPFAMTVIVLVPPMMWMTQADARGANYLDFLLAYAFQAREALGVKLPDLGHAWFLPYLFVYCSGAALLMRFAPRGFEAVRREVEHLSAPAVMIVLALCYVAADAVMGPRRPITNMLIDDVTGHVRALPSFVLGLFLAHRSRFWTRLQRARSWLGPLAAGLFLAVAGVAWMQTIWPGAMVLARLAGLVGGIYGAAMMMLVLALVSRRRMKPGSLLSYFSEAVMPIYLMHQPAIVLAGKILDRMGLPLWLEYGATLGFAAGAPLLIYHFVIRPCGPLRMAFGLKAKTRSAATASIPG
ncbi:MAG TPA: acyltransferase family protein [Hyphomonadaceae bacterium]|nr:acyltransferase family protein [Hyphomonadaceae bacterium]